MLVPALAEAQQTPDTTRVTQDTTSNQVYTPTRRPTFTPRDRYGDPFSNTTTESPLFLKDPSRMKLDVDIDTAGNYTIYEKIGELNYRPTSSMSFEEFKQYQERQILKDYWQGRARAQDGESAVSQRGLIPKIFISPVLDRIFGGSYVELVPRGFVTLDFGGQFQKINNPTLPIRQQRNGGFEFDQQINMSVVGKVGEKLAVTANFDNNNSFDFQNNMKVEYTGFKEDILQKLEIGNVSLPLNNTLIQGAQNLFGIKAQLQFGKLNVTTIATTQRGKTSSLDIGGGGPGGQGQGRPFELIASQYDENRHFFLGHFFRDNYRKWIENTPQIISGVNIMRVEVYIVNRNSDTQTLRNVVAFTDLAEPARIQNPVVNSLSPPDGVAANGVSNTLWLDDGQLLSGITRDVDQVTNALTSIGLEAGVDFERITGARKLSSTEYTVHPLLGYITLTRKLQNDEALAVAYEYTYRGQHYKVGELSEDYGGKVSEDQVVFLKLLRQRNLSTFLRSTAWDLMMKNIYSLGINQLSQEGFQLRVIYKDDASGVDNPQLQEPVFQDRPLVELFGLDRLNAVNDPFPDGNFDYVEGITVNSANGLIIFPYLEPFGEALRNQLGNNPVLIKKYSYDTLYNTTKAEAELFATKNKFWLKGFYQSSGGSAKEILIPGFGVAQGSVKLFAGGLPLMEGTDYVVDYTFGKVTILNDAILNSGKNIEVQFEQNDPFAFQTRSLLGTRFDYRLSDDVNFGSTFLYYNERPMISRNQIGTEPARNIQYGLDFNVNKKSRVLTKLVDALPFLQTKEQSSINVTGEFAQLIPGTSNVIDGEGTAYVDDFESTATPYSLMNPFSWKLAAVPKTADNVYEGMPGSFQGSDVLSVNFRRAKLAWYTIDNQLQRNSGRFRPENISQEDMDNHYVRGVGPQEIFPSKQQPQGVFQEQILDIAYYPNERGPYNYNDNLDNAGRLPIAEVEKNWAGITNAIRTEVDFDKANIEYIEFWLLDPFLSGPLGLKDEQGNERPNTKGGKIIFQLGSISEDVIPDSKHAFANGLPPNGELTPDNVTETPWGYVTEQQYLTNGFDNTSASSRTNQDVGLDGISSANEVTAFNEFLSSLSPEARAVVEQDPSADDYKHFLDGSYDGNGLDAKVLQRYKNYNGMDGNTPIASNTNDIATANYQNPDNEDINADNTLNDLEEYYEYDIDLRKNLLQVGQEYIVDKQTTEAEDTKESVTWYLFRIPVRSFERSFGNIQGFKSIRYSRMILTGFSEPVVLRMANFRMVGSRWRRYPEVIYDGGIIKDPEKSADNLNVSVVSLEENYEADVPGNKSGYRIPPNVVRDRAATSSVSQLLNEQSMQVCIDDLADGEALAVYKNLSMDLFNYGNLRMFFHANSYSNDDELHAFIRMGTDFDENYYQIEIPLKVSNPNDLTDRGIWPEENEIDLALDELYELKAQRDRENFPLTQEYPRVPKQVGRHLIKMIGRPDLSSVQLIMIGVRNPTTSDKRSHSACVWANELRVTDFNRTAGWAVSSTVNAKLADFAVVQGAFRHMTFGFGGVSSKIFERTREETTAYDLGANVNVDKLIPGNTGIKIPMFLSYENTVITPQYDPANPDMKTDVMLRSFRDDERDRRDEYLRIIQDRTTRRSLNFTNVRKVKVKPDAPTHLWDIENFAFSYAFSEAMRTSFTTALGQQKQQRGSVAYQFSPKAAGIEPFKDVKAFDSPWLQFLKDFNLNLLPSSISVRLDLERSFGKTIYRNSIGNGEFSESRPNYLKYFTFNRQYNMRWDISKNLSLEYNARANAIIDEPYGDIDTKQKRDSVLSNLKKFGRMKNFDQGITANYKIPFDKFPITDWIGADYRYSVNYNWKAGPVQLPGAPNKWNEDLNFRNTIQNSREHNYSGRIDFVKLYNKVKFLKEINTPPRPESTRPVSRAQQEQDTTKKATVPPIVKGLLKLMMSVKSLNGTYSISEGTVLPGFDETPRLFGLDRNWSSPGWKFVLGDQDPDFRRTAADKGWLVKKSELSTLFTQQQMKNLNLRGNVEPARDLKIQIDVRKESMTAYSETFRWDDLDQRYESFTPFRNGSYRISTMSIRTAFDKTNDDTESQVFQTFEDNLDVIRQRFNVINNLGAEYDSTSQDVLIPAFIAAYTGKTPQSIGLGPFAKSPMPNWRVDYTGLSQVGFFKDLFQSVTISHAYQSIYSVSNYSSTGEFSSAEFPVSQELLEINRPIEDYNNTYFGQVIDGQLKPLYIISSVMISEQFSPLIGVNVRTKSRVTANLQYKTKRDIALTVTNAQVTEMNSKDISFELGFTKNNMKLPFKSQGRTIVLKNDVTFRLNSTIGNTKTIQRKIEEEDQITNGNINFQLRPNVSYTVNQKLTVQLYFERNINEPLISISSRRATTRFGAQVRFSLAQ